jgi:hypothetical protein
MGKREDCNKDDKPGCLKVPFVKRRNMGGGRKLENGILIN